MTVGLVWWVASLLLLSGVTIFGRPCSGVMEERYEALKELGAGNFGVARLVRDKRTKELVAVKYIERGKKVYQARLQDLFRF